MNWFRKAAEQGDPVACANLAYLTATGQGVTKDLVEGYKWFYICKELGNQLAREDMRNWSRQMSRAEVGEAERRAKEWLAKFRGN